MKRGQIIYQTDRRGNMFIAVDVTHKYGKMGRMKTTIEIPERTFRQAKSLAGSLGISLKQLFNEALEQEIRRKKIGVKAGEPPWMHLAGALGKTPEARAETRRIQKRIDDEFGKIDEIE
jgi:hypothetical protein